jgi:hypothetical protein
MWSRKKSIILEGLSCVAGFVENCVALTQHGWSGIVRRAFRFAAIGAATIGSD